MSNVEFTFGRCPSCAQEYRLPAEDIGKQARCRACGKLFEVLRGAVEDLEASGVVGKMYDVGDQAPASEDAFGYPDSIEAISDHIARHIGPVHKVFHEMISDMVHIDVHWVKPGPDRPFHTLVTSGMSDRPMNAPEGAEECQYAELVVNLPADWKVSKFKNEAYFWPIRLMKQLARYPHQYNAWIWYGHSMGGPPPAAPLGPNCKFTGLMLATPMSAPDAFETLTLPDRTIHFFVIIPLYPEELDHKMKHGLEKLLPRFDRAGITDIIDVGRKNVCRKLLGLW